MSGAVLRLFQRSAVTTHPIRPPPLRANSALGAGAPLKRKTMPVLEQQRATSKITALADQGKSRIEWAATFMPVLAQIRERFAKTQAARRRAHRRVPSRDDRNREPDARAQGRRRRYRAVRVQPALDARRRRGGARPKHYEIPTFAIKGEDNATYYSHIEAVIASQAADVDGRRLRSRHHDLHQAQRAARGHDRRLRRDDDGRHPPARDGEGRRAAVSGRRGQRRADQAHVRQPLRHRAVDARRRSSARRTC